jgi:hypothetical protein
MADANGSPTTHFAFTKLAGTDVAGHNSINAVVDTIDTSLYNAFTGMIVLYQGATAPSGWSDVDAALVAAGGPASGTGYIWIKKA